MSLNDIDVLILCGGKGSRLKAFTKGIPKPMVKIDGKPFLDLLINYLAQAGFKRFILGTGYKSEFIRDYYRKNKISGTKICFCREEKPLGTGGALKHAEKFIRSRLFLVLNGDSFSRFNAGIFLNFHRRKRALLTILLTKVPSAIDFGRIEIDKSGRILKFREKEIFKKNCLINAGVYIFERKVFSLLPEKRKFSLEHDFLPQIAGKNVFGYINKEFFIDIGTPQRYLAAKKGKACASLLAQY